MSSLKISLVSFLASVFLFQSISAQDFDAPVIVRKYNAVPVVTVKNKPGIINTVARGAQELGNNVIDLGQDILTGGQRNTLFGALVGGVADIGKNILGTVTGVVGGLNQAAKVVATGLNQAANEAVTDLHDAAKGVLSDTKDVVDTIAGSPGKSAGLVKTVARGAQELGNNLIDVGHAILTGGSRDTLLGGALGVVGDIGKEIIDTAVGVVSDVNDIARAVASGAGGVARQVVSDVHDAAKEAVSGTGVVAKSVLGGQSVKVVRKLVAVPNGDRK